MNDWLARAAARNPDRLAIVAPGWETTYGELHALARVEAQALAAEGIRSGHRFGVEYLGEIAYPIALHACLILGAAAVPIDSRLGAAERAARAVGGEAATNDVATVMYTSGTTSAPKPVELTHHNWFANACGSALALGLDPAERWLCPMPLAHVGGLSILLRSTIYATTVVLQDRFHVPAVLEELMNPERRITLVSLVPTMLSRLLDAGLEAPPTLRWALLGGAPIAPGLLQRAAEAGVPVAPTYGMTEACSQIATFGLPLHGVQLRLAEDGELLVSGTVVAPGALAPDGWLHSGDLAAFRDDGMLEIVGRKADTIVSGGENVAPAEVEAVLLSHPAVADAGVFARPDPEWGEAVIARVVLRDGESVGPDALRDFVRGRIAMFKVPKEVEFADSLPRTASGKLIRRELA
jgi:O-succinylbenzoic acid--CoA ligase